jgi:hypothetical protein
VKVEKLVVEERAISRTETRIVVSTGVLCRNCGMRIEPVVFNGALAKSWTHLGKPFRYGAGVFCEDGATSETSLKAEPLVEERLIRERRRMK